MEVVRQQQVKIDGQARSLAVKSIWTNLLNTTHTPSDDQLEDDCARVITWISLQCAHDASKSIEEHGDESSLVGGAPLFLSRVMDCVQDLHSRSHNALLQQSKENDDLRRRLQEAGARREVDRKALSDRSTECCRLQEEMTHWADRAR